ncbi:malate synthase A [Kitasatospora purpeofusca]|uniref:malate synthase A n=1 Tax=Kitasatospora purpeofusca TaxID=67352 RepID=UPI00224C9934|nr:malate synthase A [Kitasatospora purpeofusca]MCX4756725.1 malate synthase A [Kitasatospora purpeofusca]WSR35484.1 malate synthase A [Kitasatospora purpeofusca]WSR43803.1 malate synthase A [Kitasatospora purpeofusca]
MAADQGPGASPTAPVVTVAGPRVHRAEEVLTPEAVAFVVGLHRSFEGRRRELLARRRERRAEIARTGTLDFLPDTAGVRAADWRVAEAPRALQDRRVEITGPTDRKMVINALNSGAKVWLADFEDATSPTWENVVSGQINLIDAFEGRIDFATDAGKAYTLRPAAELATVVVRPRGWHLDENHLLVDGEPVAGAFLDFGLYFFHNAARLLARGADDPNSGPYFYLPKTESHLEARLWNDVFTHAQAELGVPHGTIRATVLIETITAAFEMDEILYELREHAAGLNAGRWDYLFSIVKNFRDAGEHYILPDRNTVTMASPFMAAYTRLLVRTCHRRGAHAIGGMAAFIPSRRDPEVNAAAMEKVEADKDREAGNGFDGSWVAHPDLVPVARASFDAVLGGRPHQKDNPGPDGPVTAEQLLDIAGAGGSCTRHGLHNAVQVGIRYIEAWLRGLGAVAIFHMMEDAATAEISRSQIWQWIHNDVVLADTGEKATADLVRRLVAEELTALRAEVGDEVYAAGRWREAAQLFEQVALAEEFADFLTLPALPLLG